MQVVKNLFILGILFLIINCNSLKTAKKDNHYKIEVFKSKNSSTYLNLQAFHYENKLEKYYSTYWINNFIFSEHNLNNLIFRVLPGNFEIECGAIGKNSIKLKDFEVKRGDSIVMSFFLEDSKEPLVNNEGDIINYKRKQK